MTPALDARDLYRFFRAGEEETLALRGVSLSVAAGELVVVCGPSGSGKSTLLRCLAGLDEPDGGTVRIGWQRLSHRPEAERARIRAEQLGVLYAGDNLFDHLTVAGNVHFAQRLQKTRGDVDGLLDSVGLAERAGAYPAQLSGGELARAGLAVALANDPLVLIADEPTGELDQTTEHRLLGLLAARTMAGKAVVVASHSPHVQRIADRVLKLRDGQVASDQLADG
jgi:putative ABC transport system ATP-binding protein